MGVRDRHVRSAMAIVFAALLATACGSRLPNSALQRYDAAQLGTGNNNVAAGPAARSATGNNNATTSSAGATATTTAGGGGGTGGTGSDSGGGTTDAAGAQAAADCHGGATDKGVTADEIKVGAIVTASGPLPGATEGSYRGAAAYLAKVNAEGGVCGRKITIIEGDDGLDPQRARSEFLRLEPSVFAMVGGFAVADSGYQDLLQSTGIPYVGVSVNPAARQYDNVMPHADPNVASTGPYVYLQQQHPNAKNVAFLFADVGGVRDNTPAVLEPLKRVGYNIVYNSAVSATSPDYTAEVINMQRAGTQMIYLFAFEVNMHVRMARNMRQQNFEPELKVSQIGYNSQLIKLLGDVANGWINPVTYEPMLDAAEPAQSPALQEFLKWNNAVFPGAQIDLFPVDGWANAALFVRGLQAVGADLTRDKIVQAINSIPNDDGGGMIAPIQPQARLGSPCFIIESVQNQQWVRDYPQSGYECNLGETFRFG